MSRFSLKPTHKAVTAYYDSLARFAKLGVKHESAVRLAFATLLEHAAGPFDWKLVPEYPVRRKGAKPLKADGAILDNYSLTHGLWEAKDSDDDLEKEIKAKFAVGYPKENILFQEPRRAVLFQNGERTYEADLTDPEKLVHILKLFLEFAPPAIAEWEKAVEQFRDKVPELGISLQKLIRSERQTNSKFIKAFADFVTLCRTSLNPNLREEAVEEMLIQHLLTERIFRKVFDVADFMQRNVIAVEIEKVITALTSKSFSRDGFVAKLNHFYGAIENAAATIHDFNQKQTFLNTVYERFFQGFSVDVADTHGIVYTPQPLVQFMIASVEHVLKEQFGKSLADRGVQILDPFTGTGNYIVNLIRHLADTHKAALPQKFAEELFCNEVMLLPYYIASMNIEHAYYEATGKYEPFEGICLVDTFQTAEKEQHEFSFFNAKNSERVERQKKTAFKVIIANPPYNANQLSENDNNKNRKYAEVDKRVRDTYVGDSKATLRNKLSDPYVKAFRWASDRLGKDGMIVYVSNNSFLEDKQFDGMRKHLASDFSDIWVLDLKGDARTASERRRQEGGNVFSDMIRVGVCVTVLSRRSDKTAGKPTIRIHRIPDYWKGAEKLGFLETHPSIAKIKWEKIEPDETSAWLNEGVDGDYGRLSPIGVKKAGAAKLPGNQPIFRVYTLGASTNRDEVVYDFKSETLAKRVKAFIEAYNVEIDRYSRAGRPKNVDDFVDGRIKWSRDLKLSMVNGDSIAYDKSKIRTVEYRPFTTKHLYFHHTIVDRIGPLADFFPTGNPTENRTICLTGPGSQKEFLSLMTKTAADLHFVGAASATQTFPLYTYSDDGKERNDNITQQALTRFKNHYDDDSIKRLDIFHYIYAMLHHPAYRARYAENLKRELPRIPLLAAGIVSPPLDGTANTGDERTAKEIKQDAEAFWAFAKAGKRLAELHVNYEKQPEFPLKRIENKEAKLNWRVETMKLTKDHALLIYNDWLSLAGIPEEVFAYRLGNRSALEWVIDQYRVTRDADEEITSDPNRLDDEEYIVRLIGQVVHVSVETLKVIGKLPELKFP